MLAQKRVKIGPNPFGCKFFLTKPGPRSIVENNHMPGQQLKPFRYHLKARLFDQAILATKRLRVDSQKHASFYASTP